MKAKYIFVTLTILLLLIVLTFLLWNFAVKSTKSICSTNMVRDFKYPEARRDEAVVDDFHGTKVNKMIERMKHEDQCLDGKKIK